MKKLLFIILLLAVSSNASHADIPLSNTARKIIIPDWVKSKTIKYGLVGSFCAYQGLTGMAEGYHFRQAPTHIINGSNYHMYATAQRTAGIVTGWFGYALFADKKYYSWKDKFKISLGSALLGRNMMEWSYKYVRYGNAWDYTKPHNECAFVGFKWNGNSFVDFYIGTGPISGPIADSVIALAGLWLLK